MIAEEEKDYPIGINEKNRELYANEFVYNGEYGGLNNWKPSIDTALCQEWQDSGDGYVVATPLGYEDYTECDIAGIKAILATDNIVEIDRNSDSINVGSEPFKLYDHVKIKGGRKFVLCGVNRDKQLFYVADENGKRYYCPYEAKE